jgi:hypothetical protein
VEAESVWRIVVECATPCVELKAKSTSEVVIECSTACSEVETVYGDLWLSMLQLILNSKQRVYGEL